MAAITSAVVGVVGAGVSMGMSIAQASKAAKDRAKAQKAAKKAIEEAKRETEIMPMQELALNLDVYKQAQEAQNVTALGAVQAAQQGQGRQLAAAVGMAQQANIAGQQNVRAAQAKEMFNLNKIKATERQEASDERRLLSVSEAEGAQAAAADAESRRIAASNSAVQAGVQGLGSAMDIYSSVQGPFDPTALGKASKSMIGELGIEGAKNAVALNLPEGSAYSYDQVIGMNQNELLSLLQSGSFGDVSAIRKINREFDPTMYRIQ